MPLTLDTTVGGAAANAYCDETYVDGVAAELLPVPEAWAAEAGNADLRRRAIVMATRAIDQFRHRGTPVTETQALAYPRDGAPDASGLTTEASDAIPTRVKRACALAAIELVRLLLQAQRDGETDAPLVGPSRFSGLSSVTFGSEFSATFETGGGGGTPFGRYLARVVRRELGTLVLAQQPRILRG